MKIFLLRHAQAENTYPDYDRQLTKIGYKQIENLAKAINPDIFKNLGEIWYSPYIRTKQSQAHLKEQLSLGVESIVNENILPDSDFKSFAKILSQLPLSSKDILIVSHNFFLEELINLLLFGENNLLSLEIKKASLTSIELIMPSSPKREYGAWSLKAHIYPKFLKS